MGDERLMEDELAPLVGVLVFDEAAGIKLDGDGEGEKQKSCCRSTRLTLWSIGCVVSGILLFWALLRSGNSKPSGGSQDQSLIVESLLIRPSPHTMTLSVRCAADDVVVQAFASRDGVENVEVETARRACGPSTAATLLFESLESSTTFNYRLEARRQDTSSLHSGLARSSTLDASFTTAPLDTEAVGFTFTVSGDTHRDEMALATNRTLADIYSKEADQLLASMARRVVEDESAFHIDLGCSYMVEKYTLAAELNSEAVHAQVAGYRRYWSKLATSVPLLTLNGPHEAENWKHFYTQSTDGEDSCCLGAWAAAAKAQWLPSPVHGADAFYRGQTVNDSIPAKAGVTPDNKAINVGNRHSYWTFDWTKHATIIGLDPWWNEYEDFDASWDQRWRFSLGRTQYDFLNASLALSTAKHKFVFLHNLVGGANHSDDLNAQRGGASSAAMYGEWGGADYRAGGGASSSSSRALEEFQHHRPGWPMPIHDLLVVHDVDAVIHAHDHVNAIETRDGIVYLELAMPDLVSARQGDHEDWLDFSFASNLSFLYTHTFQNTPTFARFTVNAEQASVDVVRVSDGAVLRSVLFA